MKHLYLSLIVFMASQNLTYAENVIDETILCRGTGPFWSLGLDISRWQDGPYARPEYVVHSVKFALAGASSHKHTSFNESELETSTSINDASIFSISAKRNALSTSSEKPKFEAFLDFKGPQETKCNDGMSDFKYTYSLYLKIGSLTLTGCCDSRTSPKK